jgi:hypothetical protein
VGTYLVSLVRPLFQLRTVLINAPSQAIVTAVTAPHQTIEEAIQGWQRTWLVLGFDQAIDYQFAQKEYFDQHYLLLGETQIGGIYLLRYELAD